MTPLGLILLALIGIPPVGLTVAGVLLILKRRTFSARGRVIALVLGIIGTSFGVAMTLALLFMIFIVASSAEEELKEWGTSAAPRDGLPHHGSNDAFHFDRLDSEDVPTA